MKMTISIPEDLYWRFRAESVKRRKAKKDAVAEALEQYITDGVAGSLRSQIILLESLPPCSGLLF